MYEGNDEPKLIIDESDDESSIKTNNYVPPTMTPLSSVDQDRPSPSSFSRIVSKSEKSAFTPAESVPKKEHILGEKGILGYIENLEELEESNENSENESITKSSENVESNNATDEAILLNTKCNFENKKAAEDIEIQNESKEDDETACDESLSMSDSMIVQRYEEVYDISNMLTENEDVEETSDKVAIKLSTSAENESPPEAASSVEQKTSSGQRAGSARAPTVGRFTRSRQSLKESSDNRNQSKEENPKSSEAVRRSSSRKQPAKAPKKKSKTKKNVKKRTDLDAESVTQLGDAVRQLKSAKAPQDQVTAAVNNRKVVSELRKVVRSPDNHPTTNLSLVSHKLGLPFSWDYRRDTGKDVVAVLRFVKGYIGPFEGEGKSDKDARRKASELAISKMIEMKWFEFTAEPNTPSERLSLLSTSSTLSSDKAETCPIQLGSANKKKRRRRNKSERPLKVFFIV